MNAKWAACIVSYLYGGLQTQLDKEKEYLLQLLLFFKTKSERSTKNTSMASGGEQVSSLAEKLETMSTSEPQLYKVEKVAGKGVGCIAMKEIKKGSLVLREAPQLLYPENGIRTFVDVLKVFVEMSKEDRESYLDLHNKFDDDKTTRSNGMKQDFANFLHSTNQMTIPNISQEKAFKVMAIKDTNGFGNGVCLKMSRFNHSCYPNAQSILLEH